MEEEAGRSKGLGLQGRHEGALHNGAHAAASRSESEEQGAEDTPELSGEGAGTGVNRVEGEAALGLTRMGSIRSPLPVV